MTFLILVLLATAVYTFADACDHAKKERREIKTLLEKLLEMESKGRVQ